MGPFRETFCDCLQPHYLDQTSQFFSCLTILFCWKEDILDIIFSNLSSHLFFPWNLLSMLFVYCLITWLGQNSLHFLWCAALVSMDNGEHSEFMNFLFLIGILIYNVMLVSSVQQSDFSDFFPYRFLQNIEYSSLCYTVGSCWLSILNITPCIC